MFKDTNPEDNNFRKMGREEIRKAEDCRLSTLRPLNDGEFALVVWDKAKGEWMYYLYVAGGLKDVMAYVMEKPDAPEVVSAGPGDTDSRVRAFGMLQILQCVLSRVHTMFRDIRQSN